MKVLYAVSALFGLLFAGLGVAVWSVGVGAIGGFFLALGIATLAGGGGMLAGWERAQGLYEFGMIMMGGLTSVTAVVLMLVAMGNLSWGFLFASLFLGLVAVAQFLVLQKMKSLDVIEYFWAIRESRLGESVHQPVILDFQGEEASVEGVEEEQAEAVRRTK